MDKKVMVSLSGGLDSCVMLAEMLHNIPYGDRADRFKAVTFRYGSKHGDMETTAAQNIAAHLGVPHNIIDVRGLFDSCKSALMKQGGELPHGHYESESMKQTVVPGRNLVFASILAAKAEAEGYDMIALGVHQGDRAIYPDCRPAFIFSLKVTVAQSSEGRVNVFSPFLMWTKKDIVRIGLTIGAPFLMSRTCYEDTWRACGKCASCQERLEAFHLNDAMDPIDYCTRELLPK